jgi:hypothetical protein
MIMRGTVTTSSPKFNDGGTLMNNGCLCHFLGDNWIWVLIIALLISAAAATDLVSSAKGALPTGSASFAI